MFKINADSFKKTAEKANFKLGIYYYLVELVGIVVPFIFGAVIIYYPNPWIWLDKPIYGGIALIVITFLHTILFILHSIFKKDFIFSINRYFYVSFFFYLVIISGTINSSVIFLLLIPILVSVVYLDRKATRNMGIFISIVFFSLIFLYDKSEITSSLITKHITQSVLLIMIIFFIYRIVVETLKQKYERDQASKKLTEMVQIDSIKNDFLSIAQHQLRTPLSGVKWALELLKSDNTLKDDTMSIIDAGLERIKDSISIINKMLQTIENKKNDFVLLKKENTDIDGLIRTILAELNFIILKKKVKVIFNNPYPIMIFVDKDRIKAALNNIIDNSIKYSPNGQVSISIKEDEKNISIEVKDTGIGIIENDLPYVFERLHRGTNAMKIEPDESGIGLYTSKKIIELHGGSISISSELNKGTTVTVILPK